MLVIGSSCRWLLPVVAVLVSVLILAVVAIAGQGLLTTLFLFWVGRACSLQDLEARVYEQGAAKSRC